MNTLEDRLRVALEETAEEIAPHSVPPLRLNQARRMGLPGVTDRHRWTAWLTPLAAAAAVTAVIIASVAIAGTIGSGSQPGARPGPAGLPRYYVALRFSSRAAAAGRVSRSSRRPAPSWSAPPPEPCWRRSRRRCGAPRSPA